MNEVLKEKNKNLINLRTSLITIVIVITSGLVSLFFMQELKLKMFIFMFLAIYFDIVFLTNIMSINKKIEKNLGDM